MPYVINYVFLYSGVSERARKKLMRASSASSSEPSPDDRVSPVQNTHNHNTASPAQGRKPPQRPPPPGEAGKDHGHQEPKKSFFDTLEWQDEDEVLIDQDDTPIQRTRYDSTEAEFEALSSREPSSQGVDLLGGGEKSANLLGEDFGSEARPTSGREAFDLLNMNTQSSSDKMNQVNDGMSLLDIGQPPEPSNLELLTGAADLNLATSNKKGEAGLLGDTFDPFQDAPKAKTVDPFQDSQPQSQSVGGSAAGFDVFQSASSASTFQNHSEASGDTKPKSGMQDDFMAFMETRGSGKVDDNLMGGWDLGGLKPQRGISPTSPEFGLGGGGSMAGKAATSPGFGASAPQQQQKGFAAQPSKSNDPFADLSK